MQVLPYAVISGHQQPSEDHQIISRLPPSPDYQLKSILTGVCLMTQSHLIYMQLRQVAGHPPQGNATYSA